MYAVLGDRDKQAAIRGNNPDVAHCNDLEISARACDGCKHNPHSASKKSKEDLSQYASMVTWAQMLGDYAELGILPSVERLSPQEALAARYARIYLRNAENKRLAKLIGMEVGRIVGELLAAMFKKV